MMDTKKAIECLEMLDALNAGIEALREQLLRKKEAYAAQ